MRYGFYHDFTIYVRYLLLWMHTMIWIFGRISLWPRLLTVRVTYYDFVDKEGEIWLDFLHRLFFWIQIDGLKNGCSSCASTQLASMFL